MLTAQWVHDFYPQEFSKKCSDIQVQKYAKWRYDMTDYDGLLAMVCKPSGCRFFLRQDGTRSDVTQRRA